MYDGKKGKKKGRIAFHIIHDIEGYGQNCPKKYEKSSKGPRASISNVWTLHVFEGFKGFFFLTQKNRIKSSSLIFVYTKYKAYDFFFNK